MKKLLILLAPLALLTACHMDENAAGEAIFKNKGACCGHCQDKQEKKKDCHCKAKHDHSHKSGSGHHHH